GQSIATHGVSFRMDKDLYKVDEEYTVRATYGNRQDEDKFVIDQCDPIIQVYRDAHGAGDDMVLIVIDPNSNKDSETVEYVGDRRDSMLVIETDHDRLEGYRLAETGCSTGIFRGAIRILVVSYDGIVVPLRSDELAADRTRGSGISDGYILVRPGGKVAITYKYGSRSLRLEYVVADLPLGLDFCE
ncbi:MAG: hypothetical protein MPK75_02865, partial [Alphaproteobacteria bacterium]|nr:hypothetical protein [Alphaproteobacteria bacterium]